ncbi:MAG: DUF5652 family protein [Patescibacteria group bacterium]
MQQTLEQFFAQNVWILPVLTLWAIPWKGVALWKAARLGQKWWFVALLIVNTAGILEILYIFVFSKQTKSVTPRSSTPS